VAESLAGERGDSFSAQLWDSISDIYGAILAHPFITGLTDGTLPAESFAFYVVQDALYLQGYARALAAVGSRAPTSDAMQMFARHAADAVAAELELHATLLAELGISADDLKRAEPAPTNLAYTSYLLATAHAGSYAEGVGAVLPCYWIYWEVGKELLRLGSPDPRYQRWISAYAAPEFGAVVAAVIAEADRIAPAVSAADLALMRRHFLTTSRYEFLFWDAGYRRESWPILSSGASAAASSADGQGARGRGRSHPHFPVIALRRAASVPSAYPR
jgi:thiaminase (transcriptional activator TenA)